VSIASDHEAEIAVKLFASVTTLLAATAIPASTSVNP
jgi:hypothetical protein